MRRKKMQINQNIVNKARLESAKDLARIIEYLNKNKKGENTIANPTRIQVDFPEELQAMFQSLTHWIVVLACVYDEDDPDKFSNLADMIPIIPSLFEEQEEEEENAIYPV
jgi:hypothetical protein